MKSDLGCLFTCSILARKGKHVVFPPVHRSLSNHYVEPLEVPRLEILNDDPKHKLTGRRENPDCGLKSGVICIGLHTDVVTLTR